jgi:hypothetical protein
LDRFFCFANQDGKCGGPNPPAELLKDPPINISNIIKRKLLGVRLPMPPRIISMDVMNKNKGLRENEYTLPPKRSRLEWVKFDTA